MRRQKYEATAFYQLALAKKIRNHKHHDRKLNIHRRERKGFKKGASYICYIYILFLLTALSVKLELLM